MVVGRIVDRARKKAGRVYPFQLRARCLFVTAMTRLASGGRRARPYGVLGVRAEIVERVGIAACNDLTGAGGKFAR